MKLGILGGWGHFVCVLDETKSMNDVSICGLASCTPDDSFEKVRKLYPSIATAPHYDDYKQLLTEQKPDVVTVSTRIDCLTDIAIEAANAGCHIICEKPLAIDHQDLVSLWDAVTSNGVQCLAMLAGRSHPILATASNAVKQGLIGDVKLLNAQKSYKYGNRPDWFGQRSTYGGTIPWIGIHALDFINSVTDSSFTTVAAMHANAAHPQRPDCEDICGLVCGLPDGGIATASIDILRADAAITHGDDWLRIVGSKGIIEAGMCRESCTITTDDTPQRELDPVEPEQYYAPFLRNLDKSAHPPNQATRRSFQLTHAALCARDAADTRSVINIPDAPWNEPTPQSISV
ncbi:Gfo/Idh/MocA family oxidoreductase [Planctomycetota bacterium]|nr:Gfo/Idh/MocA family oxidoreductase [Planctomycetota bacterium]